MNKKYYFFVFLAVVIGLSSCKSLRIEKRHYNNGFYVDFGNDKNAKATPGNSEAEQVVTVEVAPQPVEENSDRAIPATSTNSNSVPSTSGSSAVSDEIINAPSQDKSTGTEVDQQEDATRVESDAPVSPNGGDSDVALILLVILAIILPPLAVFLVEGTSKWFWVTLILCIFGGGIFFTPYLGGLWLIAAIIALLVVLGAL